VLRAKKSLFSEEQFVRILKEVEAGAKVAETRDQRTDVLRLEVEVRRHGCLAAAPAERA